MARPRASGLTENELCIMRVLWDQSPRTVAEILEALPRFPKPAYNSVLTLVTILERKGHIARHREGKAHRYYAVLEAGKYKQSEIKRLVHGLFAGNALDLAVSLIKTKKLSPKQRDELKKLLEDL